jgi:uncharacterized protein DUF3572
LADNLKHLDRDGAEVIAIAALTFLAEDGPRLGQFLATSGIGPEALKTSARTAETLASVLEFLLQDESMLLMFSSQARIAPEAVAPAHYILANASTD